MEGDPREIDLAKAEQPWEQPYVTRRDPDAGVETQNGPDERTQERAQERTGTELGEAPSKENKAQADEQSDKAEEESAQRRWSPPQPTVDRGTVRPKGGWWQRRGEG
jgi:hypothetical protein